MPVATDQLNQTPVRWIKSENNSFFFNFIKRVSLQTKKKIPEKSSNKMIDRTEMTHTTCEL